MLGMWLMIGIRTLFQNKIEKLDYFLAWFVLMLCIVHNIVAGLGL